MGYTFFLIGYCFAIAGLFIIFPRVKKNAASFALCIGSVFIFLMLIYFRPHFFRDTIEYENAYKVVQWSYVRNIDFWGKEPYTYMEYGYVLIELIFKSLGLSFSFFSACISLFFVVTTYFWCNMCYEYLDGSKVERRYFFAYYALYLSYFGLLYNFVTIRSGLSFAFLSIASFFSMKRKPIKMVIFWFLAFSIQRLSIIALVPLLILFLDKFTLKKNRFLIMWIFSIAVWIIERSSHILLNTVGAYIQGLYNDIVHTGSYDLNNNLLTTITTTVQCFIYIANGLVYYLNYQEDKHYSSFAIIYLLTMVALSVTSTSAVFYRIVDYLYLFSLPINYFCCINWKKSKTLRIICLLLLTVLGILVWGKNFLYWYLYD